MIILFVVISAFNTVNADLLGEMEKDAASFITKGHAQAGNINYTNIASEFSGLGSILTMIGAGVLVAVTTYMGIKYLTAGPEAQAKLKTQLVGVVVSGIVIFGAYGIWKLVIEIASQF
jgi:hypothetical protein